MNQKYVVRNAIYGGVLIALMLIVYQCRKTSDLSTTASNTYQVYGSTMGTTYTVKYLADEGLNYQQAIDSLLKAFNQSLSTYIPDSEISQFNKLDSGKSHSFKDEFFYPVLAKTKEIYQLSQGAFDPTLAPVIRVWGFGETKEPEQIPTTQIDSLLNYVGFDKYIIFDEKQIQKTKTGVQLNFNAIAQGYGVDVIALFLEQKGISNYMVEIGGEVRANGNGLNGEGWRIGIDKPIENADANQRPLQAIVTLKNKSLVTSGNYRKFYIRDGKKYPHTINPLTGYPVTHNLLSVTILADDAMTADAVGTACMVLGKDKALELVAKLPTVDVFLVYDDNGTLQNTMSEGMKAVLEEVN